MRKPKKPQKQSQEPIWLSSGSTRINCAATDNPFRCYKSGGYYLIRGDSTSGKTVLAGTAFAEACINPKFDGYDLYFDNVENGALFFEKFFGPRIASRIKPPAVEKDGSAKNSSTVEDFYDNLYKVLNRGKPVVYILDSETALTSVAEVAKQSKQRKSRSTGEKETGSMGDAKAKVHSTSIRGINQLLKKTNSILIIICQTRDNMGFGAMFEPKTSPGGKALKFYAQFEAWTSAEKRIKKVVNDKPREIGVNSKVVIKKNRFTGKVRTAITPIYHSVGIDDTGSCVDFLIDEGRITRQGKQGPYVAKDFKFSGTREQLVQKIEQMPKGLRTIRKLVGELWKEIESKCVVVRKNKYI